MCDEWIAGGRRYLSESSMAKVQEPGNTEPVAAIESGEARAPRIASKPSPHGAPSLTGEHDRLRESCLFDPTVQPCCCVSCTEGGREMDELGFSDYVTARRPQLFRTACFICGDPHRAEDIVQDALSRLYAAWSRVERMDNIDGYVRRIIVNAHLSDRRRPWRRERVAESRDVSRDMPIEPGFAFEDAAVIRSAVMALPVGQRRVIVLRHIWDLTIQETAAELGISPGTVKSQSADAAATLRKALAPSFGVTHGQEEVR